MNKRLFFNKYREDERRIIFSNYETKECYEIDSIDTLEQIINNDNYFFLDVLFEKNNIIIDYFLMKKTLNRLYLVKHDLYTNAYFKSKPDKLVENFITLDGRIYRYIFCQYNKTMQDYIIECPEVVSNQMISNINKYLETKSIKNVKDKNISFVLTNTNRFAISNSNDFIELPYNKGKIRSLKITSSALWKRITETESYAEDSDN